MDFLEPKPGFLRFFNDKSGKWSYVEVELAPSSEPNEHKCEWNPHHESYTYYYKNYLIKKRKRKHKWEEDLFTWKIWLPPRPSSKIEMDKYNRYREWKKNDIFKFLTKYPNVLSNHYPHISSNLIVNSLAYLPPNPSAPNYLIKQYFLTTPTYLPIRVHLIISLYT